MRASKPSFPAKSKLRRMRWQHVQHVGGILVLALGGGLASPPPWAMAHPADAGQRLKQAYPDHISAVEGNAIIMRDGTRLIIDDGRGQKSPEVVLADPDLEDIFTYPYASGTAGMPPARGADPGRARPKALFDKIYGDCRRGEVTGQLEAVPWLPKRSRQRIHVTRINGVADRLRAVSNELDRLPRSYDAYLLPAAGGYACRTIDGTDRMSAHGYGIAIDIALKHADYWRWPDTANGSATPWRNRIPIEIVRIFERYGFIWGGKWDHFDTMHFEYRPEMLLPHIKAPRVP